MTIRRSIRWTAFGPIGRITWRPTEITDVTLSAATYLDEATDPNSSGTRNWSGDLDLVHAFRENLKLQAGVGVTYQDTQGIDVTDVTVDTNLGLTWQINRWLAWKAEYDFTWFDSNLEGSDYTENQISVGIGDQKLGRRASGLSAWPTGAKAKACSIISRPITAPGRPAR